MKRPVLEFVEIDAANWRRALAVMVRPDQLPFVAEVQPVALVILAKCYVRPEGQIWTPYVALYDGTPVGVTAIAQESDQAHLRHFAIDHQWQGQGLGRLMLDAAIAAVRDSQPPCRQMQVTTHPDNDVALTLYQTAGFTKTGELSGIEPVLVLDLVGPAGARPD